MHVDAEDVAPETVAFSVVACLSAGWTVGSVLAGEPLSDYLLLLATLLSVGAALYADRSGE